MVEVLFEGEWTNIMWRDLKVGDICKVVNNQFFPADLVLLATRSVTTCFNLLTQLLSKMYVDQKINHQNQLTIGEDIA